jgi:hypothetical protein
MKRKELPTATLTGRIFQRNKWGGTVLMGFIKGARLMRKKGHIFRGAICCVALAWVFVLPVHGESTDAAAGTAFLGTWLRQGTYINGALEHTTPATLVLKKDSFFSTGTCTTSGSLTSEGATMTMKMTQSSCPGGLMLPYTVTFAFNISEKSTRLTMQAGNVMEFYERKAEKHTPPKPETVPPKPRSKLYPEPKPGDANTPPGVHSTPSQTKVNVQ